MNPKACDDCGRLAHVLVLTDYGCRYCRDCLRPGNISDRPKVKKAKASKQTRAPMEQGEDVF